MRVQCVFAPSSGDARLAELSEELTPPLGIMYLAASIREAFPEVSLRITDGLLRGYAATAAEINDFRPDLLLVSFFTPEAPGAYALVKEFKERYPQSLAVMGGIHATALPEEALERCAADLVVLGEGEETVRRIVRAYTRGEPFTGIPGICYRSAAGTVRTPPAAYIRDIDTIPFPARDLVDLSEYKGWFISRQTPETGMFWSRGCPFNCTFCSNLVWKTSLPALRLRSAGNIADEMEQLKLDFGIREVFDHSDEFNNDIEHAKEVCRELIRRKLGMTWKVQLRAHPLPEELVRLMKQAGCWYVHLGIESANEETLRGIRKKITLEQVRRACALLKKYEIRIFGLFMLFNVWEDEGGLCFEDLEATRKTLAFAGQLVNERLLDYISWTITTPYPGSRLYDIALRHGLIRPELLGNWDRWLKVDSFIMDLPGMHRSEQARLYTSGSWLRARCYLRSRGFGLKDIGYMARKAMKVVQIQTSSLLPPRSRQ
ncbi:MAG: B12-binding domain-containing radical SAM protein [Candidatus Omnitrophica bacterium]|nr:B12-binding domain-containing radical SAM protein [Candidatus Omnitrophota bacterium]